MQSILMYITSHDGMSEATFQVKYVPRVGESIQYTDRHNNVVTGRIANISWYYLPNEHSVRCWLEKPDSIWAT